MKLLQAVNLLLLSRGQEKTFSRGKTLSSEGSCITQTHPGSCSAAACTGRRYLYRQEDSMLWNDITPESSVKVRSAHSASTSGGQNVP